MTEHISRGTEIVHIEETRRRRITENTKIVRYMKLSALRVEATGCRRSKSKVRLPVQRREQETRVQSIPSLDEVYRCRLQVRRLAHFEVRFLQLNRDRQKAGGQAAISAATE